MPSYEEKKQRLVEQMRSAEGGASIGLRKDTSNLFRDRAGAPKRALNVRDFRSVLSINAEERWVDVEGMTPYAELVDVLLPHGFMPAVVPQLKSITIGGAVSGIGIEATSFRHGLVHETILEMDVLLADGAVVTCTPTNEHRDLFHGMPNSYGTLGYILRLKAQILPIKPYVCVEHQRFADAAAYFRALKDACNGTADFVDGVAFAPDDLILSTARFVDEAPFVNDYTYRKIYYRSFHTEPINYLTAKDYIWRWDTDWFWCSRYFGFENPLLRLLLGRRFLNSVTYMKLMRLNSRWGLTRWWQARKKIHSEAVIQDILIPIDRSPEFLRFLFSDINITPIWMCPTKSPSPEARFPLFPMRTDTLMVDFGFWGVVTSKTAQPDGATNRNIERTTQKLGGIKSLYSDAFYPLEEFWNIYNRPAFDDLKHRYDPSSKLKDLHAKTVMRQ
jgi:FAD/FMN-containing dehydrogenase